MTTKIQDSLHLLTHEQNILVADALTWIEHALPAKLKAVRVQVVRGLNGGCRLHIVADYADPSPTICTSIGSGYTVGEAVAALRTLAQGWSL